MRLGPVNPRMGSQQLREFGRSIGIAFRSDNEPDLQLASHVAEYTRELVD